MTYMDIVKPIDSLLQNKDRVILAIDGSCTAGKTTLANLLAQKYDCSIFHMDDFFLRPEQRTEDRYAEPGGNVDYERFHAEVLTPLMSALPFTYRPFSCRTMQLAQGVAVTPKQLTIIEGTYSHHPYFRDPYDLKIFLTVSPELQQQRILQRPAFLHRRFFEEWIPMEHRYFEGFSVEEKADMVLELSAE